MTALDPYEAILAHAERELELAGRGELDELQALSARWSALTSALPERAPAAAQGLLERAALIHERTRIELLRIRDGLTADMGTVTRSRRAARGYGGPAHGARRVNHSA